MRTYTDFRVAVRRSLEELLHRGMKVHSKLWQGIDISLKPEAEMHELLNWGFSVPARDYTLPLLREDIGPNLPWADLHFDQERVGGQPLNPGETWKIWPWGNSADKHRTAGQQFNHTYAERFWPKFAGQYENGVIGSKPLGVNLLPMPRHGIRYEYADLNDLLRLLAEDPLTRQAYIPIWFPEDGSHSDRKPCTLGYQVIRRGDFLHMVYFIRSCDALRHFQDDVYLAVRLLLWIIDEMRVKSPETWDSVVPGMFTMHITSFHCFIGDLPHVRKKIDGR